MHDASCYNNIRRDLGEGILVYVDGIGARGMHYVCIVLRGMGVFCQRGKGKEDGGKVGGGAGGKVGEGGWRKSGGGDRTHLVLWLCFFVDRIEAAAVVVWCAAFAL